MKRTITPGSGVSRQASTYLALFTLLEKGLYRLLIPPKLTTFISVRTAWAWVSRFLNIHNLYESDPAKIITRLATATTWFFNFVLSITWPSLQAAFTTQGAFSWYAGWNVVGFFLVLFFVPETKGKTLEELDQVFSVPTRVHAAYGARQIPYFFKRYILRQDIQPEILYERDDVIYEDSTFQGETGMKSENRV